MKKLLYILFFLFCFVAAKAQFPVKQNLGAPQTEVIARGGMASDSGFIYRSSFADTTAANAGFLDAIAGITIRTSNTLWIRSADATRWIEFGAGSLNIDTTQSIILSGDGSNDDPLTANLQISTQQGNSLQLLPDGVYSQSFVQNGRISGGQVLWETGLTYTVTPTVYAINSVQYSSPETEITLSNSDPTNDRIDLVVVNTDGDVEVIEGTPSSDPQEPSYDPTTQLPLSFILVTAASTEPTYCRDSIYYPNNGQNWTAAVSNASRLNVTSTNNPYSPTQDVEGTAVRNNDTLRFTKGSTISWSTYSVLAFKIRSKGAWPTNSRISLRAFNGSTPQGISVAVGDGIFGFNSSNTAEYQTVAIQLSNFGSVTTPTNIVFAFITTGGNTIGFYLDNIELLGCGGTPTPTSNTFWQVGGNRQGTTLVGGTLDNNPVAIVSNNAERMRVLTSGKILIGTTTENGLGGSLQVSGLISPTTDNATPLGGSTRRWVGVYTDILQGVSYLRMNVNGTTYAQIHPTTGNLIVGSTPTVDIPSAAFAVNSTTKGVLLPRMTTAQKNAISAPATSLLVYDTDLSNFYYYNGAWLPFGTVTASNGLSASGNNVTLGGSALTGNTSITTSAFSLTIPSSNGTQTLSVTNSSTGAAIIANSTGGVGLLGISAAVGGYGVQGAATNTGYGVRGTGTSGSAGVYGETDGASYPLVGEIVSSTTNTIIGNLLLQRMTDGTAATGIGQSIDFRIETTNGSPNFAGKMKMYLDNVVQATRTAQFQMSLYTGTTENTVLAIANTGTVTLGAAYQGLGAGYLAVSNTGELTWSAGGGGGGGDALTSNPLSQFAATTSAQLAGVISDETGSGLLVFATSPVLTTPNLGTPSAATLTNATGLPIATGVSGLGTGVAAALAVNTGSAGAIVLFNGALGTPTSGTLTNATGLPITAGTTGTLGETRGGTNQTTYTTGDILYASAANTLSKLAIGTSGQLLRVSAGGIPEWFTSGGGTGTVTSITLNQPSAGLTITNSGVPQTTVANFTFALSGKVAALQAIATTGIMRVTGVSSITAGTAVSLTTEVSGTLPAANGGTGFTGSTANGQLLIGNGTTWSRATVTGTSNQINITNGSGSITISHAFNPTVQTLISGATITWNITNGANAALTLNNTGATLNITNPIAGYTYTIVITQGSGGSRTITTWPTGTIWPNATPITLSTTAGQRDIISFYYNGTNYFPTYGNNYN